MILKNWILLLCILRISTENNIDETSLGIFHVLLSILERWFIKPIKIPCNICLFVYFLLEIPRYYTAKKIRFIKNTKVI